MKRDDRTFIVKVRRFFRDLLRSFPKLDGFFRRVVWSRIHFPEMELRSLNRLPPHTVDVAIDVGAALCNYSWVLSRKAKKVFAFEPGELHGLYLKRTTAGTNVELVRAAVGDNFATVDMYTPGSATEALHSATLSKRNPVAAGEVIVHQVRQITLDGFFEDKLSDERYIDVLKVDVEGYENAVFRGAQSLLRKYRPLIICEIEARHNPEYHETFDLLRNLGYKCHLYYNGAYHLFEGETIGTYQSDDALEALLSGQAVRSKLPYLNNFVFQHAQSRVKIA